MTEKTEAVDKLESEVEVSAEAMQAERLKKAEQELVARTEKATKELAAQNREMKKLIMQREVQLAEQALGGKAEAGQPEKKEEDPKDYAKRVLNGDV